MLCLLPYSGKHCEMLQALHLSLGQQSESEGMFDESPLAPHPQCISCLVITLGKRNKYIHYNVLPQAIPGAQLPGQARRVGRRKPAKESQATGNAGPKGKIGRPANLRVAASCSVLPSLLTLELSFTGTVTESPQV